MKTIVQVFSSMLISAVVTFVLYTYIMSIPLWDEANLIERLIAKINEFDWGSLMSTWTQGTIVALIAWNGQTLYKKQFVMLILGAMLMFVISRTIMMSQPIGKELMLLSALVMVLVYSAALLDKNDRKLLDYAKWLWLLSFAATCANIALRWEAARPGIIGWVNWLLWNTMLVFSLYETGKKIWKRWRQPKKELPVTLR